MNPVAWSCVWHKVQGSGLCGCCCDTGEPLPCSGWLHGCMARLLPGQSHPLSASGLAWGLQRDFDGEFPVLPVHPAWQQRLCPSLCRGHLCSVCYPVTPLLSTPINICLPHHALPAFSSASLHIPRAPCWWGASPGCPGAGWGCPFWAGHPQTQKETARAQWLIKKRFI